jgi:hypothetical protein
MIDVYKHALIGGKWCTSFWVKSLIQWKKINIWMDYYLASTHSFKVAILVEIHNIDFQPNKPRNNFKNSQLFICIY